MRKLFILFLMSFALNAQASSECSLAAEAKLAIGVHASNWANANTTRTPEGGPYKYQKIVCSNNQCHVEETLKVKKMYEPGHPDADEYGYVETPDIDKDKELATLSSYADVLRLSAHKCPGTEVTDNYVSAQVEYRDDGEVKLDLFNFRKNRKLISWFREYQKGNSKTLNF